MAKKPGTNPKGEFAFFNVFYEDGSQRSNRRVPSELLGGLDGDEPARAFIMEQDREIAEKSRPPGAGDQEPRPGWGEEEVGAARWTRDASFEQNGGPRPAVFVREGLPGPRPDHNFGLVGRVERERNPSTRPLDDERMMGFPRAQPILLAWVEAEQLHTL